MCETVSRPSVTRCTCGVEPGEELGSLRHVVAHRLARAWVSLGCGGLVLFVTTSVLAASHHLWSTVVGSLFGLGGVLVVRGLRVVSKSRRELLLIAAQTALPPARIVP